MDGAGQIHLNSTPVTEARGMGGMTDGIILIGRKFEIMGGSGESVETPLPSRRHSPEQH
jgi:hypothetical protein